MVLTETYIKTEYTDEGVVNWYEGVVGGVRACRPVLTEWGEADEIQWCPRCGEAHSAHSRRVCFGCTFGLTEASA